MVASNENDFRIVSLVALLLYIKREERRVLIRTEEEEEDVACQVRVSDEFGTNSLQVVNGSASIRLYIHAGKRGRWWLLIYRSTPPQQTITDVVPQRDPR
jgi:hypothetical protein